VCTNRSIVRDKAAGGGRKKGRHVGHAQHLTNAEMGRTNVTLLVQALEAHVYIHEQVKPLPKSLKELRGHVYIEDYAYGMFGRSASVSNLCETPGIFTYLLANVGVIVFHGIPNSRQKKVWWQWQVHQEDKIVVDVFLKMITNKSVSAVCN
jgi:hypothetical protein